MPLADLIQSAEPLSLPAMTRSEDEARRMRREHVAFAGSPMKHPEDDAKVMVVADPFSSNPLCYVFQREDIGFVEKLSNLGLPDGQTVPMARIWVKKGALGLRQTPFVVQ